MRNRYYLAFTLLAVIGLGLASRRYPGLVPDVLGKYPGDALWSVAVYLGWAVLLPNARSINLAGLALAVSYLIELLQLYDAPWLDAVRATVIGHLILGSTFNPIDLVAYSIGVALALAVDVLLLAGAGSSSPVRTIE